MNNLEKLINDAKAVIEKDMFISEGGEEAYLTETGEENLKKIITQAYNQGREDGFDEIDQSIAKWIKHYKIN